MKKMYFFTRKNGRIVKERISMSNSQTKNYLRLLKDMFGRANVICSSNETCLLVENFCK